MLDRISQMAGMNERHLQWASGCHADSHSSVGLVQPLQHKNTVKNYSFK